MAVAEVAPARRAALPRWPDRRITGAVVLAAVALTVLLRLPYLTVPFGPDEGGLSFIARQWGSGHGSLYGAYWLDRPPLLLALFKLAVAGGTLGVRALGAVAAGALVVTCAWIAHRLGGPRAARTAAVLAAVLASAVALAAVFTPAELLAAVPAAASAGCLVLAHRRGRARELAAAGALAATALLIKQSFVDAGVAGAVFLGLTVVRLRSRALPLVAAYAAGAFAVLAAALGAFAAAGGSLSGLAYAVIGFRLSALGTLSASSVPLHDRVTGLALPAVGSGLVLVLALVPLGLARLGDRRLAIVLGAWLGAGVAGVLAGGSYWPHYLIQLVAPASALAAVGLARVPRGGRIAAVSVVAAVAIGVTAAGAASAQVHPRHVTERAIARFVAAHARPGDTQYVLYAHANLDEAIGLPSPYPYAWSLMVRGIPGAIGRLDHLLASPRRPTWVVGWEPIDRWGLDPHHVTERLLGADYRVVGRIGGRPIWHARPGSTP